jgi:hypothetical protein
LWKMDNCQVGALLTYRTPTEATLIDLQLHLLVEWINDPGRCEKAGIPM